MVLVHIKEVALERMTVLASVDREHAHVILRILGHLDEHLEVS